MKLVRAIKVLLTPLLFCISFISCGAEDDEIARITGPDFKIDAVLTTRVHDGTMNALFIVPHGARISGKPTFTADHSYDAHISWKDQDTLVYAASNARVWNKQNIASVTLANGELRKIKVMLKVNNLEDEPIEERP